MVQLRVWIQSEGYYGQVYLDLYDNVDIPATKQFNNVQDLGETSGSFAKNFFIPFTAKNARFFSHYFDVTASGLFNAKKRCKALLEDETIAIVEGSLQLVKAIVRNEVVNELEIRLFGEVTTLFRAIGNNKLNDYQFPELAHFMTLASIEEGLTTGINDEVLRYALIDFGRQYTSTTLLGGPWGIYMYNLKPLIQAKYFFDRILHDAGFTWQGETLATELEKRYILCHNSGLSITTGNAQQWTCKVGLPGDINCLYNIFTLIEFSDETSFDFHDDNGVYDEAAFHYVAPTSGFPLMTTIGLEGMYQWRVSLYIDSPIGQQVMIVTSTEAITINVVAGAQEYVVMFNPSPDVATGSFISCYVKPLLNDIDILGSTHPELCWFEVVRTPPDFESSAIDITANLPREISATSLVKTFFGMFNCIMTALDSNPNHLIIEPYGTWMELGAIVDWTDKVDHEKAVTIEPMTAFEAQTNLFTYKKGNDTLSGLYASAGHIYGQKKVINTGNEFATGEKKIELAAESTPVNAIPGTEMMIPKLFDSSGAPVEGGLRILRYGGLFPCTPWTIVDINLDAITLVDYPYFGHYERPIPIDVNETDDNFGSEVPMHVIYAIPQNTLYRQWWLEYLESIYDRGARFVSLYIKDMDAALFRSIQFNDRIWIKNSYFRLNRIVDFQSTAKQSTLVELIKYDVKLSFDPSFRPCGDLELVAIGIDGHLIFEGDDVVTQGCCESLGGVWANGNCWNGFGNTSPHGGGVSPGVGGSVPGGITQSGLTATNPNISGLFQNSAVKGLNPWIDQDNVSAWGLHKQAQSNKFGNYAPNIDTNAPRGWLFLDTVNEIGFKAPNDSMFTGVLKFICYNPSLDKISGGTVTFSGKVNNLGRHSIHASFQQVLTGEESVDVTPLAHDLNVESLAFLCVDNSAYGSPFGVCNIAWECEVIIHKYVVF